MLSPERYKIEGALIKSFTNLAYFWSLFELVVCMIGLENWLRHDTYKNKINCVSY